MRPKSLSDPILGAQARGGKPVFIHEAHITESVRDPNAYIVETFPTPSGMTKFSEVALNEDRVNDIIGFLQSDKLK